MKTIIFSLLLILTHNTFSQRVVLSTHTQIVIDKKRPSCHDYMGDTLRFTYHPMDRIDKQSIVKYITQQIEQDSSNFSEGFKFDNYSLSEGYLKDSYCKKTYKTVNNKYFTTMGNKNNYKWYENDSIFEFYEIEKLDTNDNIFYDSIGDPILETEYDKIPLINRLYSYGSVENWEYTSNFFSKNTIINDIGIHRLNPETSNILSRAVLFISTPIHNINNDSLILFKENICYNQLLQPYFHMEDNHNYSNVEKFIDTPYKDKHFTNQEIYNAYTQHKNYDITSTSKQELVLFLRNITESIYSKKVDVYDFENNKISISKIDTLISTKEIIPKFNKYDEYNNNIYDTIYVKRSLNQFVGIRFEEDWYFSTKEFNIIKKVKSISFLVKDYNEKTGDLIPKPKVLPFKITFNN